MTQSFFWREWVRNGGRQVAGPFDTARDAGRWRADNPPLLDGNGPTLQKLVGGVPVRLSAHEVADAFTEFVGVVA